MALKSGHWGKHLLALPGWLICLILRQRKPLHQGSLAKPARYLITGLSTVETGALGVKGKICIQILHRNKLYMIAFGVSGVCTLFKSWPV